MAAIVKQIDHILTAHADPAALYTRLTETLGLPVVWALRDHGIAVTGGVFFGNVDFEILGLTDSIFLSEEGLRGIAFEPPSLETALGELKERGIEIEEPQPFKGLLPDGTPGILWTNVILPSVAASGMNFICARAAYAAERRKRMLAAFDGGTIGMVGVREVVVGAQDIEAARTNWGALLAPAPQIAPDVWQLGEAPALRLVAHDSDALLELVIQVRALDNVRGLDDLLGSVKVRWVEGERISW
jgi:hypothetical protein